MRLAVELTWRSVAEVKVAGVVVTVVVLALQATPDVAVLMLWVLFTEEQLQQTASTMYKMQWAMINMTMVRMVTMTGLAETVLPIQTRAEAVVLRKVQLATVQLLLARVAVPVDLKAKAEVQSVLQQLRRGDCNRLSPSLPRRQRVPYALQQPVSAPTCARVCCFFSWACVWTPPCRRSRSTMWRLCGCWLTC